MEYDELLVTTLRMVCGFNELREITELANYTYPFCVLASSMRNEEGITETVEYYSSEGALKKYGAIADDGLTEQERRIVDRHFTKSEATVLDLGCGVGRTTQELFEAGFEVIGVDISERMVRTAANRFPHIVFQVGDASSLGFRDGTFDYVFFPWNGMSELPEEPRLDTLDEIRRVLKPDGKFAFSTMNSICYYLVRGVRYPRDLIAFWVRNVRAGRTFSKYKFRERSPRNNERRIGETYFIDPVRQRLQLRERGFETVEIAGDGTFRKYVHPAPYYVARKV